MNRFVMALSAVVSGRSAWLLLGVTGMAYTMGASAVWSVVGYIVAELLLFVFYARRLRRFTEAYDCITLPDFFAARFTDRGGGLRITLVVILVVFMVSYVAAQFVAGGKAIAASFPLSETTGTVATAAFVLLYTALGGFLAVSLTDMIHAFFMIFALLMVPVVAISNQGGLQVVLDQLSALDPSLIDPFALSFGMMIGFIGIGMGSPGNPHILVRYMSIRDPDQLRYSAVVGTIWNVLMSWGAVYIGLVGRLYYPDIASLPAADTERLYPALAQQLLPPFLFGAVLASIFAAIMSTADSQLLVATSSIVRDTYEKILKKGETIAQRRLVLASRIVVLILVGLAFILGIIAQDLVFWLVLFAWGGLGAALGPTSLLALYWKGTTRYGVLAGLIVGTATVIIWYNVPLLKGWLYELIPAFTLSLIATIVVSRLTQPPENTKQMFQSMGGKQELRLDGQ
jgi:sodium/proline symporter